MSRRLPLPPASSLQPPASSLPLPQASSLKPQALLLILGVVLGTTLVVWFVWRMTWFGARLDDRTLIEHLAPDASPRDVQHAIHEVAARLEERQPGMERWVAPLVQASRRSEEPIRVMAAWAMQGDAAQPEFADRLREMLADPAPLVRRNAATSLARAPDDAARPVLREMLEPWTVTAPVAGRVSGLLGIDHVVRHGAKVAGIESQGREVAVLAPVPGRVLERMARDGDEVASGAPVLLLGPDPDHAMNAAKGLVFVGTREDVALLSLLASPRSAMPDRVQAQARAAIAAIEARGR